MFSHFKRQAKYFFLFSRGERRGIALLSLLLLALIAANFFVRYYHAPALADWIMELPMPVAQSEDPAAGKSSYDSLAQPVLPRLRNFDPNTISREEGLSMGLQFRLVEGLLRYRQAGGVFRRKADLARLHHMSDSLYRELEAYILLPDSIRSGKRESQVYQKKKDGQKQQKILELNSCDSAELVSLKWVGPYSASRIIKFRERLGGFIKKEQLLEVWGMNDSFYRLIEPQLTLDPSLIRGVHINSAGVEELKAHPYIWRYQTARAIVNYREQHGPYRKPEDLKQVILVHDSVYTRLLPYIRLD